MPVAELAVQQQVRQSAEVVAVQVGHGHDRHVVGVEAAPLEPNQGARAAVQ